MHQGLRPRARVLGRAGRPVTPPYSAASREPAPAGRNRLAEVEEGYGTRRRAASPPLRCPGSPPLLFAPCHLIGRSDERLEWYSSGPHVTKSGDPARPVPSAIVGAPERPYPMPAPVNLAATLLSAAATTPDAPALVRTRGAPPATASWPASSPRWPGGSGPRASPGGPGRARRAELGGVRRRATWPRSPEVPIRCRSTRAAPAAELEPRGRRGRAVRSRSSPGTTASPACRPSRSSSRVAAAATSPRRDGAPWRRPGRPGRRRPRGAAVHVGHRGCAEGRDAHARQPRREHPPGARSPRPAHRGGRRRRSACCRSSTCSASTSCSVWRSPPAASVVLVEHFDATRAVDARAPSRASRCSPACRRCTRRGSRSTTSTAPADSFAYGAARGLGRGARCRATSRDAFRDRFGVVVHEGYGLTEAAPIVSTTATGPGRRRPGRSVRRCPGSTCASSTPTAPTSSPATRARSGSRARTCSRATGTTDEATARVLLRRRLAAHRRRRRRRRRRRAPASSTGPRTSSSCRGSTCTRPRSRRCCMEHPERRRGRGRRASRARAPARPSSRTSSPSPAPTLDAPTCCPSTARASLARYKCPTRIEIVDELPHTLVGKLAAARCGPASQLRSAELAFGEVGLGARPPGAYAFGDEEAGVDHADPDREGERERLVVADDALHKPAARQHERARAR